MAGSDSVAARSASKCKGRDRCKARVRGLQKHNGDIHSITLQKGEYGALGGVITYVPYLVEMFYSLDGWLRLTCMRVRYTGLFIRIHVAVSKHGGIVIDPS